MGCVGSLMVIVGSENGERHFLKGEFQRIRL